MRCDGLAPIAAVLVAWPLIVAAEQAPASWLAKYYNAQPADGDIILPLPCGGAMTFRKVETLTQPNLLGDNEVQLGSPDDDFGFSQNPRRDWLVGSLGTADAPDKRFYEIDKYEVTRDQFHAVMGPDCPTTTAKGTFPADAVSWFEAVTFTEKLSTWLLSYARDQLPTADGVPAFVRLPTEAEWEFAARGGLAVSESDRRALLFPMQGTIDDYAWFRAPGSCDGGDQPVGRKKPNPLGIHDILGNVAEIVLEPYQMTRSGRLHGQVGGFVTRGGGCNDGQEALISASRVEQFFFDPANGAPTKPRFTGFRVVLAAPVQTSQARIDALRRDWDSLGADQAVATPAPAITAKPQRSAADATADPLRALESLAATADDAGTKSDLGAIAAAFRTERQLREEGQARAARTAIIAGAALIRSYRSDNRAVLALAPDAANAPDDSTKTARSQALGIALDRRALTRTAYLDLMQQTADDTSQATLAAQLPIVRSEYAKLDEKGGRFGDFAERFVVQIERWRAARATDYDALMKDLTRD